MRSFKRTFMTSLDNKLLSKRIAKIAERKKQMKATTEKESHSEEHRIHCLYALNFANERPVTTIALFIYTSSFWFQSTRCVKIMMRKHPIAILCGRMTGYYRIELYRLQFYYKVTTIAPYSQIRFGIIYSHLFGHISYLIFGNIVNICYFLSR